MSPCSVLRQKNGAKPIPRRRKYKGRSNDRAIGRIVKFRKHQRRFNSPGQTAVRLPHTTESHCHNANAVVTQQPSGQKFNLALAATPATYNKPSLQRWGIRLYHPKHHQQYELKDQHAIKKKEIVILVFLLARLKNEPASYECRDGERPKITVTQIATGAAVLKHKQQHDIAGQQRLAKQVRVFFAPNRRHGF